MSKEALYSNYPGLVFRETFRDEQSVRRNGGNITGFNFNKGTAYRNTNTSNINYPNVNIKNENNISIRLIFKTNDLNTIDIEDVILKFKCGTTFIITIDNSDHTFKSHIRSSCIKADGGLEENIWYEFIMTYDGINHINYINSKSSERPSIALGTMSTEGITIGNNFDSNSRYFIDLVEIYDRALTKSKIKNLYNNTWNRKLSPSNVLLDFNSSNGLIELGDRADDSTITDVTVKKQGAEFNGSTSKITVGNIGTVNTLNLVLYYDGTDQSGIIDLDGGTNTVSHSSGTLSYFGDNAYINGIDTDTLSMGWNFITIVDTTGTSASAFRLGYDGTNYFKGKIAKCQAYEGVLDLQTHTQWWTENLKHIKG